MTRIEGLGPIGISLNISPDETYLDEAARLESLGYSAIWLRGGQIDSLDRGFRHLAIATRPAKDRQSTRIFFSHIS